MVPIIAAIVQLHHPFQKRPKRCWYLKSLVMLGHLAFGFCISSNLNPTSMSQPPIPVLGVVLLLDQLERATYSPKGQKHRE